ncbi:MAG: hypothetical protein GTO63_35275 [Anaerolineae bacterium]|nr:hypothetical protein [Anaerolineae bacterium]NIN99960.1 hypothetical protein [Anaerolineae bacterium]NIQ82718.1 hypothetical protein [Anaerolineae bacterium]
MIANVLQDTLTPNQVLLNFFRRKGGQRQIPILHQSPHRTLVAVDPMEGDNEQYGHDWEHDPYQYLATKIPP